MEKCVTLLFFQGGDRDESREELSKESMKYLRELYL